jgi:16S rRNA (uracil1498-N3)-methyltransferase
MPRIFLPSAEMLSPPLSIRGEKAKYLTTVLRCRAGDRLVIHDDRGNSYTAEITGVTSREVTAELTGPIDWQVDSPLHVTLLQGILKGEKMDFVIQKATELGVGDIIPVVTERSQVRQTRKIPRWTKIAEEAARQSGRNSIPCVHDVMEFDKLPSSSLTKGILFWEEGGADFRESLLHFEGLGVISLFTGPEGGFSERETASAAEKGFLVATLGRRILRAETAAIAAVAVTQFTLGDLGR